jgi:hypothetical protein
MFDNTGSLARLFYQQRVDLSDNNYFFDTALTSPYQLRERGCWACYTQAKFNGLAFYGASSAQLEGDNPVSPLDHLDAIFHV